MKTYTLTLPASPATQTVRDGGRGYVASMAISHSQATAQAVTCYDRDGVKLAEYIVAPGASPFSQVFPAHAPMWFHEGLLINTGDCVVNMVIVY
jgi:hypothetical protein